MESLFVMVETAEEVIQIQNDLAETETIAYDIETTGFDFKDDKILLIQFRINGITYLIDTRVLKDRVVRYILELIQISGKPILAHNAKFDIKFTFEKYGIMLKNIHCTMISEYLITEAREKYASYQELCFKYLGELIEKDTVMKFVDIGETEGELTQDMLIYGATDVLWLDEIRTLQLELLKERKMNKVYNLEMQLVPVVTAVECNGVLIDYAGWMKLYEYALEQSDILKADIINAVWRFCMEQIIPAQSFVDIRDFFSFMDIPFKKTKKEGKRLEIITFDTPENLIIIETEFKEKLNLASPKQVKKFLQLMGSGVDSTAEKVLKSLAKRLPVASLLLDFRKNFKRVTTYGLEFLEHVRPDGRIYARFNQIGTATGRFSCVPTETSKALTKQGWKFRDELEIGQQILGFDIQKEEYVWTTILNFHGDNFDFVGRIKTNYGHDKKYYKGPYCTGNHRWVVKSKSQDIIGFTKASTSNRNFRILLSNNKNFPEPVRSLLSPKESFLWGWYLTDGYSGITSSGKRYLEIQVVKKRSIKQIENFAKELNIEYTESFYDYGNIKKKRFYFSVEVFDEIYKKVTSVSPSELVINLSTESRETMLIAMLEGDGSKRKGKERYDRFASLEENKDTAEFFEILADSLGYSYSAKKKILSSGKIFIEYSIFNSTERYADKNYSWKPEYETEVWCPETSCGTWVMKQGNESYITGNSRQPNLQNIIAGSDYRMCFIAPEGKKIITADYSQQEFRLAGELSGEPAIIEAYQKGLDMHTATASMLFHIPLEEVTPEQRKKGKTVNFAVLYGTSSFGLARTMSITGEEAEKLLADFIEGFPKLSAFQKNVQELVWKIRYSTTPLGRRRGFRKNIIETGTEFYKVRGKINREGFNHVVQGGSADMIKFALLMMQNDNPFGDKFKIIMTVHDEIVAEVDDDIAEESENYMRDVMVKAGEIFMTKIPTLVGVKTLPYWSK